MLSKMNDYKHLPSKEFDAMLGKLLQAEADKLLARVKASRKPKAEEEKPPTKKKA